MRAHLLMTLVVLTGAPLLLGSRAKVQIDDETPTERDRASGRAGES
jgi:hypothetical protein